MDELDFQLLKILKENARETVSNMSKSVHLSVSAVGERIRKMEENGTIQKYTIILDEKKMGLDVVVIMEVCLEHPKFYDAFTEAVLENDHIVDCHYLTGDFDFFLKIVCSSSEELEQIHRQIMSIKGVSNTRTHYVLKCTKNSHGALLRKDDSKGSME